MRIGILTTGQDREDQRLIEAGTKKGHDVTPLPLLRCSMRACPDEPKLYFQGKSIEDRFDVIVPRINVNYTAYGLAILRQFQAMNVYTTDNARAIELGRDKLRSLQHMIRGGIPFPVTGFAYSKDDFDNIINTVGGTPIVIKLIEGTEGVGVFLADDVKQAKNLLRTFKALDARLLVQEFIQESYGVDMRVFVVGGKIVAAMERRSQDGDFRANISQGGVSYKVDLTEEEKIIAIKACEAIGINIGGVDIIRSNRGPLIIEINVSPDFSGHYGLEETSGVDVAGAIIDHAVEGKARYDRGEGVWLNQKVAM